MGEQGTARTAALSMLRQLRERDRALDRFVQEQREVKILADHLERALAAMDGELPEPVRKRSPRADGPQRITPKYDELRSNILSLMGTVEAVTVQGVAACLGRSTARGLRQALDRMARDGKIAHDPDSDTYSLVREPALTLVTA